MRQINESEFNNLEGTTLVEFFATWCGPCKMYGPTLERLNAERDDLEVVQVDIDKEPEFRENIGIGSVPTTLVMRDGVEVDRIVGGQSTRKLNEILDAVLV